MFEGWVGISMCLGQSNPQLHCMESFWASLRELAVADALTCGHDIHLTGQDLLDSADAIAMFGLALEQPAYGLQPGMRVLGHHHAIGLVGWAEMIDKTPGSDGLELGVRDVSAHFDSGSGGDLYEARFDDHILSLTL